MNLPPLDGLRVFEAAARRGSFNAAAAELNLTPSAVSHRIRTLEDALQVRLFDRAHRRVVLTPEGAGYAASVAEALAILRAATRRLSANRADGPLAMTLSPAFALRWLLPRLTRFQQRHPDIELRFVSTSDLHDFRSGDLDLAVRYGRGDWPGLEAEWLMALDATAVCTPEVAAGGPPLDAPADVARRVRIHVENRPDDWRMWLLAAGVEGVDPAAGPVFESVPVALEAALNHIGMVIADRQILARDLADGRLVEPFDVHMPSTAGYYLVYPPGSAEDPRLRAFRDWMREEIAEMPAQTESPTPD
ncbi:MAG: transcriptional regulator GcvA [Rhodospirillaceae bacterium]|nr:transcriptional regulator GcvA [Rhodospirillaceae bacterium]